jgi:ABC-type sulfate transport system substrate-binding protein
MSGECGHEEVALEYLEVIYRTEDQEIIEERVEEVCQNEQCQKMFHSEMMIWI